MDNSLGKNQRLKGKKVVSEIFGHRKQSVNSFPFRAFFVLEPSKESNARFGFSVPKKKFKRAVDRNKVKRLVKEAVRQNKTILAEELYSKSLSANVMIVCNANEIPKYNLVEIKIKEILERLAQSVQAYEKK